VGQLLQGRFKANLVEKEGYLLELARYIVLNPVRAHIVPDPAAWAWSSYRATAGIKPGPAWLTTEGLLGAVGGRTKVDGQRRYRAFVRQGMEETARPEGTSWERAVIGGEAFLQWVRERLQGRTGLEEVPRGQRLIGRPPLASLFAGPLERSERNRRIREAFGTHGYRLNEIAAATGLHYSRVSHIASAHEE
jgi:hypothetical protein